jgi:hypothetical protein
MATSKILIPYFDHTVTREMYLRDREEDSDRLAALAEAEREQAEE